MLSTTILSHDARGNVGAKKAVSQIFHPATLLNDPGELPNGSEALRRGFVVGLGDPATLLNNSDELLNDSETLLNDPATLLNGSDSCLNDPYILLNGSAVRRTIHQYC